MVELIDFFGQTKSDDETFLDAGITKLPIDLSSLATGNYLLRVTMNGQVTRVVKVLVKR